MHTPKIVHRLATTALALALSALTLSGKLSGQTGPEAPRALPAVETPAPTSVIAVAAASDLQGALDRARNGAAIEIACGVDLTGAWVLPNRGADTSWITIRGGCPGLPPLGVRLDSATARRLRLPRLLSDGTNAPVLSTADGANHYRITGLEITLGPRVVGITALVALGSDQQTNPATIPRAFILDHLYVHGRADAALRRCWALNSASTSIVDSWCDEVHQDGSDSQAIMGWTGPGPYRIENNRLEAEAEVIMFGGGDPLIPGLRPCDITVRRNYLTRPLAWRNVRGMVKNLFELKNACRVLVEGNVMENNWAAAQDGTGVLLKSTNQGNTCPWCGTTHVKVSLNRIRNTPRAFNLTAHPEPAPVEPMHDVEVSDNIIELSGEGGGAVFVVQGVPNLSITRNTATSAGPFGALIFHGDSSAQFKNPGFRFVDNITTSAADNWGIFGDGTGRGLSSLDVFAPSRTVTGNVFGASHWGDLGAYALLYPPGNFFVGSTADVGFDTSGVALRPDSRFVGRGANVAAVLAATAGVITGTAGSTPTPTPTPVPVPVTITLSQLRAALAALEKVTGPTGREALTVKRPLVPLTDYVRALIASTGATP